MTMWNGLPIIIIGKNQMLSEVINIVNEINEITSNKAFQINGMFDLTLVEEQPVSFKELVIKTEDELYSRISSEKIIGIVVAVEAIEERIRITKALSDFNNVIFPNLVSPKVAWDLNNIQLGMGNIIYEGNIITCDIVMGDFNIIRADTTIGHDVIIGNYNNMGERLSISGAVKVGNQNIFEDAVKTLQCISVGDHNYFKKNAMILRSIDSKCQVNGVIFKDEK